jgi:GntR family transcriptional regulator/MocR family aminotransferase
MWGIRLQHNSEIGLARQIYLSFRARILEGQIPAGEGLPSTRELAEGLSVSRNTVCNAYDMLWTEGFIIRRQGAPSRVADGLQIQSARESEMVPDKAESKAVILWDFKPANRNLSLFPWHVWNKTISDAADGLSAPQHAINRGRRGHEPLCEEIPNGSCKHSMKVDPKDVFTTSDAMQALHLLWIFYTRMIIYLDGKPLAPGNPYRHFRQRVSHTLDAR